jgi:hypothetical protein
MGPRIDRVDQSGGTVVATAKDQMKDMLNNPRLRENAKIAELVKIIAKMPDTERRLIHYWLSHSSSGRGGFLEGMSTNALRKVIAHSDKWPLNEKRLFNEMLGHSEKLMKRIATELTPDEQMKMVNRALDTNNIEKGTKRDALNAWMDNTSNPTLNRAIDDVPQLTFLIGDRIKKTGDSTVLTRLTSQKKIDVLEMALDDPKVDAKAAQGLTSAFSAMTPKEKNKVIDDMQRRNPDELPNFLKMSVPYVDHILLEGINKENAAFIRKTYQYLEAHATTQQDKDIYGKISHFMEGWMEEAYKRR